MLKIDNLSKNLLKLIDTAENSKVMNKNRIIEKFVQVLKISKLSRLKV